MIRAIAACLILLRLSAHGAAAADGRRMAPPFEGETQPRVYAEAWYGNRKVIAPVRHVGCCDEVQLPTGEWISCQFSCEIAMRKMPLSYWQAQGAGYDRTGPAGEYRPDTWTDSWGNKHGYLF